MADNVDTGLDRAQVRGGGTETTVVCLPHAGGEPWTFHSLARALPPEVRCLPMRIPRAAPKRARQGFCSIPEMVEGIGETLESQAHRPLVLLGHSMGAVLAVELTRWLARNRLPEPLLVVVSGCSGRTIQNRKTETLRLLSDDEEGQVAWLTRVAGATPAELLEDPDMRALVLGRLVHDLTALAQHIEPADRLNVPILALAGSDDDLAPPNEVEKWGDRTSHSFQLKVFSGRHFFLYDHPEDVARVIDQACRGLPRQSRSLHEEAYKSGG